MLMQSLSESTRCELRHVDCPPQYSCPTAAVLHPCFEIAAHSMSSVRSFMTVKALRYFYFIPFLTLGIYTLMDVGRLLGMFLFVFAVIHSGFSFLIHFLLYDQHFVFSTWHRTFAQLLYITLKATNAWEPVNNLDEPRRDAIKVLVGELHCGFTLLSTFNQCTSVLTRTLTYMRIAAH